MKKICLIFLLGLLASCSMFDHDSVEEEFFLLPDGSFHYSLMPNDEANNDSASRYLAHGVSMKVHPNAHYELSFDAASESDNVAPNLYICGVDYSSKKNFYSLTPLYVVTGNRVGSRFVYKFDGTDRGYMFWGLTLEAERTFYKKTTGRAKLTATGEYSDHLSLNLVIVGNIAQTTEGYSIGDLASALLTAFRKYYTSINIDTLYVNFANEHPMYGSRYPADQQWVAGGSSSDMMVSELGGGWEGVGNCLTIILSHHLAEQNVLGISELYSGNLLGGEFSTVSVGTHYLSGRKVVQSSLESVVLTVLHETGHFFGLRHTTSSYSELQRENDFSNYEDGIEDTPYCEDIFRIYGMFKQTDEEIPVDVLFGSPFRYKFYASGWGPDSGSPSGNNSIRTCPDAGNYMFPVVTDYESFSEMQLAKIRTNLAIFPH